MKKLSEVESYTWNYLESNRSHVLESTITSLAEDIHVSPATIVRTLKKKEYVGFSEYKNSIKYDSQSPEQLSDLEVKGISDEANRIILQPLEQITRTIRNLDSSLIKEATQAILNAKSVMIISRGACIDTANNFSNLLSSSGIFASSHFLDSMEHFVEELTPDDLIIALSNSGETSALIRTLSKAKANQVKSILITCHDQSTLAKMADLCLTSYLGNSKNQLLRGDGAERFPLELMIKIMLDLISIHQINGTIEQ